MRNSTYLTIVLLLHFAVSVKAQNLTVGTFNLRYDNPRDSGNLWVDRSPNIASLIRFHDFDVLGIQEGLINQLEDISWQLPEYTLYGAGRDDGKDGGEHSSIFFKKDQFKLLDKGDFWLSQTPEKPSKGWDAKFNRICTWVYLEEVKSRRQFYFFNVHYDHQGKVAREESSKLILERIKRIAGTHPAILTGDFNGNTSSSWYLRIAHSGFLADTYGRAALPYASNPTSNGFGRSLAGNDMIDHIFATDQFNVVKWGILSDNFHGKYPSDHFPVLTTLTLK